MGAAFASAMGAIESGARCGAFVFARASASSSQFGVSAMSAARSINPELSGLCRGSASLAALRSDRSSRGGGGGGFIGRHYARRWFARVRVTCAFRTDLQAGQAFYAVTACA
jgi:hypothetical protein